jgi:aminocarboxymuconate-semialdehyde decarboxylase
MLLWAPAVRYLADVMGGERVLLGSDYPFDVGDPDPTVVVREARLEASTGTQVLGDTCCGLFGLH